MTWGTQSPNMVKYQHEKLFFSVLDFTLKILRSLAFYWYQICLISKRFEFCYWCHVFMELPIGYLFQGLQRLFEPFNGFLEASNFRLNYNFSAL